MPDIFDSDRLDSLLIQLLRDEDPALRVYVYRLTSTRKVTPALFIGAPFRDLTDYLRDDFGGGDFCIMIRRGRQMLLSGAISIGVPLKP